MPDAPLTPDGMAATHAAAFVLTRSWSAAEFGDLLSSPLVFVAGTNRSFAVGRIIADEAELLTMASHPDHQRQGLARNVMQQWRQDARRRGAADAFLEVASNNFAAQNLYEANGFETVGIRKNYYPQEGSDAVDALLMRCALGQR